MSYCISQINERQRNMLPFLAILANDIPSLFSQQVLCYSLILTHHSVSDVRSTLSVLGYSRWQYHAPRKKTPMGMRWRAQVNQDMGIERRMMMPQGQQPLENSFAAKEKKANPRRNFHQKLLCSFSNA
ncbi:hypothetical protein FGO68_gene1072 [Halteria grandinella]|uniref:Uncharacterized protein n=1 Tax=Halteria grandinella TaxID=5974 RepID=A0A8J8NJ15_HALGN|nr:hypothetical protein FGO68_gene1072 [Halteria grandinella]